LDDSARDVSALAAPGRRRPHSSEERRRSPAARVGPRLAGLATAVPPYIIGQPEAAARIRMAFSAVHPDVVDRLLPVFANSGIERRYSCVPIEWYLQPHGWRERNAVYLEYAALLLERAAREALAEANIEPSDVDAVVVASTTGIATPSLDALMINRLGLRPDVQRLPIFGLGCAGGVLGLARAADLARADSSAKILFLVVELCALWFRGVDRSASNFVANALFGDGAAAAVISAEGDGPMIAAGGSHTWPDSLDIMGWDVEDDGLKAIFSRDIPTLVRTQMRDAAAQFLDRQGLAVSDIAHFVCHPGGVKVLTALEEAFDLAEGTLTVGRDVLRDYGNMSAVTVMFVLERMLKAGAQGRMLMTALGPGFTAAFQLLEAV
jgi:alkylresorcinol/alkylpyrone synthase